MVDQLNERLQEATFQGSDRLLALHHKRGSILGNFLFSRSELVSEVLELDSNTFLLQLVIVLSFCWMMTLRSWSCVPLLGMGKRI